MSMPNLLKRYEYNQEEFAAICMVTPQTLKLWDQDGLPPPERPIKNAVYYDLRVHLPWVIDNKFKKTANLREQKLRAEVEILEMQKGTMDQSLVPVAQVAEQWSRECSTMRSRLLALPQVLAVRIHSAGLTQDQIATLIRDHVGEALNCLSGDPLAASEELPVRKDVIKIRMPRTPKPRPKA